MPNIDKQEIREEILGEAYEEAVEWRLTRWIEPTRVDPGYYSDEIDLRLTYLREHSDDGEPIVRVDALATVGDNRVFHRVYDLDGDQLCGWEDV
jgi:hypothetical protein